MHHASCSTADYILILMSVLFKLRLILILFVVGLMPPHESYSQTIPDLEAQLAERCEKLGQYYNQVREFRTQPKKSLRYADSLAQVSELMKRYLMKTLPKLAVSLDAHITVPENIWVVTSADKKLRSWAWDTKTGNSKPKIMMLLEYATATGPKIVDARQTGVEEYAPDWYDTIYTVTGADGKTYYLPFVNSQYTTDDVAQRIDAFAIEGIKLNKSIALFQKEKRPMHSVGIKYNYFKNYSKTLDRERYKIKFSKDLKTLTVPVLIGDSTTAAVDSYVFDGAHYVLAGPHH